MSFKIVHCKSNSFFLLALLLGGGVGENELSCCGLMHVKVYVFDVLIFFLPPERDGN